MPRAQNPCDYLASPRPSCAGSSFCGLDVAFFGDMGPPFGVCLPGIDSLFCGGEGYGTEEHFDVCERRAQTTLSRWGCMQGAGSDRVVAVGEFGSVASGEVGA